MIQVEALQNILYLSTHLCNSYLVFRFLRLFYKIPRVGELGTQLVFAAYYTLTSLMQMAYATPLVNLATNIILLFFITFLYKAAFFYRILTTVLLYATFMLCDGIAFISLSPFTDWDIVIKAGVPTCILITLFLFTIERFLHLKQMMESFRMFWLLSAMIPIGSLYISVNILLYSTEAFFKVAGTAVLLTLNLLLFYLYGMFADHYEARHEKSLLFQQADAYSNQLELMKNSQMQVSMLKHDIKNHVQFLKDHVENDQSFDISQYLTEMYDTISVSGDYVHSGHSGVDSILNYKLMEAEQQAVAFETHLSLPEKLEISSFDLNVILGNLLDNALEAMAKSQEKKLILQMEYDRHVLYITLQNTFSGSLVLTSQLPPSSKNDKNDHGLGLHSVKNSVEKYDGLLHLSATKQYFVAEIMLYDQKPCFSSTKKPSRKNTSDTGVI